MFGDYMKKVLIGLSGGVDSSVAAAVLKEQGYCVIGATLFLHKEDELARGRDISDAKSVCDKLGIEHHVFDFTELFASEVKDYFVNSYINGETPNPCIVCNKKVKFSALLKKADEMGIDYIATGHYSKITQDPVTKRMLLLRPSDTGKDQTYVLYCLSQEQLARIKMPLADYTKAEIREKAESLGFDNANRPDSQDICFIPNGDYASFIKNNTALGFEKGDFVDINGNLLGKHQGIINYTVGQRKGLGIALGKPQFVISKDAKTNQVVLGDEEYLFSKRVLVNNLNFIPFEKLNGEIKVTAKLRYRHKEETATVRMIDENTAEVVFEKPQRAAAKGQSAVFYQDDIVIGGGIII